MSDKIRILFVCMGNICRSPSAEGVFRREVGLRGMAHRFELDSAGTISSHAGRPPDPRAQEAARLRGIDISRLRARKVVEEDFARFDHIFAMDRDNLEYLQRKCPEEHLHKLALFLTAAPDLGVDEVPDPYYGPRNGFDRVLDLLEQASRCLVERWQGN